MLNWQLMWTSLPALLEGVGLTLQLTATVLFMAAALALPVGLCRNARHGWVSGAAQGYIVFFRGTPSLVQIALVYFGLAQFGWVRASWAWPLLRDPFWCAVIALSLNGAAYTGQLLAAALRHVPKGAIEAALALGLPPPIIFLRVTLPLALRSALPAYGNEVILTLKATSLASSITLMELTGRARLLVSDTFAPYEIFLATGGVYCVLVFSIAAIFGRAERWLAIPGLQSTKTPGKPALAH